MDVLYSPCKLPYHTTYLSNRFEAIVIIVITSYLILVHLPVSFTPQTDVSRSHAGHKHGKPTSSTTAACSDSNNPAAPNYHHSPSLTQPGLPALPPMSPTTIRLGTASPGTQASTAETLAQLEHIARQAASKNI